MNPTGTLTPRVPVAGLPMMSLRQLREELAAEEAAVVNETRVALPPAVVEAFRCKHCRNDPPVIPRVYVGHEPDCPTLRGGS